MSARLEGRRNHARAVATAASALTELGSQMRTLPAMVTGPTLLWLPTSERIAACNELIEFAETRLRDELRGPTERAGDGLLLVQFARSTRTLKGLLVLVDQGFGEQALMLGRALFEALLDIVWTASNRDGALPALQEHLAAVNALDARGKRVFAAMQAELLKENEAGHPEPWQMIYDRINSEESDTEDTRAFAHWTGLSARKRWKDAARSPVFAAEEFSQSLEFAKVMWGYLTQYALHGAGHVWMRNLKTVEAQGKVLGVAGRGPSNAFHDEALAGACWTYGRTVEIVLAQLEVTTDDFTVLFDRAQAASMPLPAELARGVLPEEPCPCMVGRSFGECHGAGRQTD